MFDAWAGRRDPLLDVAIGSDETSGKRCIAGLPFHAFQQVLRVDISAGSRRVCNLRRNLHCEDAWKNQDPDKMLNPVSFIAVLEKGMLLLVRILLAQVFLR